MGNGPYDHIHRTDTNDGQRHGVTIYVRQLIYQSSGMA